MDNGTIYFKNGSTVTISDGAAQSISVALDAYWQKPDGMKRVIKQSFSADGGTNNRVITVDLESVMCIISR
ncbi:MAG: hypothetical protein J0M20_16815 [Burkholderiales bacterium]|nr:hypothetical protein [Burkholderiales bacterium]